MATAGFYGVDKNEDLDPSLLNRETRPLRFRMHDIVSGSGGLILIIFGVIITFAPFMGYSHFTEAFFLISAMFYIYARNKVRGYQYRRPNEVDRKGRIIGDDKSGIMFLGNDRSNNAGLWFSNDDLRTHMLVFGSTGSGKTRFLLGLLYQSLLIGSGCMYVDGKGDNTVWWLVYSMCRRIGREDDILVINYLTGEGKVSTKKHKDKSRTLERISNTNNPFSQGSGEQLRSLIVGLMREAGGDGAMWKGRTSAMLGGVLTALTHMRDRGEINLDIETIRSYMPLNAIARLSQRTDLGDKALGPIKKYLEELPTYREEDAIIEDINPEAYKQHGFLTMQLTEVMADLSETYGHIFSAQLGEVDFQDVVFNRRILFVMLPALEKDPDALAGLGKLVVAGVRSALAPALGNELEGTKRDVIDKKPTTSSVPFLMILDEYGYYSVLGFAIVAAQARSLGVAVIFAGQDYPSFKKSSDEEAASTVANTNITVCMKLEDPKETFDLMESRGGESDTSVTSGHELKGGAFSGYFDQNQTRIERKKRINLRDLVRQQPGEAHVIFGDEISRCRLFYADPYQVKHANLNHFIMVNGAKKNIVDSINGAFEKLSEIFEKGAVEEEIESHGNDALSILFRDMNSALSHDESPLDASIVAVGMIELRAALEDENHEIHAGLSTSQAEVAKDNATQRKPEQRTEAPKEKPASGAGKQSTPSQKSPEVAQKSPELTLEVDATSSAFVGDQVKPNRTIREQALKYSNGFEKLLNESIIAEHQRHSSSPLSSKDIESLSARNKIESICKNNGVTKENLEEESSKTIEILGERVMYPQQPTPYPESKEEFEKKLIMLQSMIDEINDESVS